MSEAVSREDQDLIHPGPKRTAVSSSSILFGASSTSSSPSPAPPILELLVRSDHRSVLAATVTGPHHHQLPAPPRTTKAISESPRNQMEPSRGYRCLPAENDAAPNNQTIP
ncbi:hypothetical protein CCHR01_17477 [Colletotrichum chrysophilum]|uniref:Uncharacterized protein n=1 Tax=Colletotrichum chrysophilum TaxID=1836956 RepID=A0AAD9E9U3_9PEZI|nr:hypothetical protein CCHR01_17477 [Colletotrichum chrysophilum]